MSIPRAPASAGSLEDDESADHRPVEALAGHQVAESGGGPNGDLLTSSYDCVDPVMLNAYFPLGHKPDEFRAWWRRLHGGSDDELDDTHLMRMAGRFARRVKAWAAADGVPVICCTAGQRKHLIAEEYLQTHVVTTRCSSSRLAGFTRTAPGRGWAVRNPARPIAALGLTLRE
jgi:hypothetical protein